MLILCPLTGIVYSNSFGDSLGFTMYMRSCHLQIETIILFFLIGMSFIAFSFLISLASTSSMMLNSSGEIGHPCLVRDFRETIEHDTLRACHTWLLFLL